MTVASLPMYDFPELVEHTNRWWRALAHALRAQGFAQAPDELSRTVTPSDVWQRRDLLLTQTCGYPLRHQYASTLAAIAVPAYTCDGCKEGHYKSAIVMRDDASANSIADTQGLRLAANAPDSLSGFQCVRTLLADLDVTGPFFSSVVFTGSHRQSLRALREYHADVAAIDPVTLQLTRDVAPVEAAGLRRVQWGPTAPALPYATRTLTCTADARRMRKALHSAAKDAANQDVCQRLRFSHFIEVDDTDYDVIVSRRQDADAKGLLCS